MLDQYERILIDNIGENDTSVALEKVSFPLSNRYSLRKKSLKIWKIFEIFLSLWRFTTNQRCIGHQSSMKCVNIRKAIGKIYEKIR